MPLVWTTEADVRDRWIGDDPIPATTAQIERLLEDAEDTILREFPDLEARVAAGALPAHRVQKVAARLVIARLRNPEGARSEMEQVGPFTRNKTFGGDEPGGFYLSDQYRRELGGTKTGRAFQIDTTPLDAALLGRWTGPSTWEPA